MSKLLLAVLLAGCASSIEDDADASAGELQQAILDETNEQCLISANNDARGWFASQFNPRLSCSSGGSINASYTCQSVNYWFQVNHVSSVTTGTNCTITKRYTKLTGETSKWTCTHHDNNHVLFCHWGS